MSNEVYNTLDVKGPVGIVRDFQIHPFPPRSVKIFDIECVRGDANNFGYCYSSDWVPPYEWLEEVVAKFPQLVFKGTAANDQEEWYGTFEGRDGQIVWMEHDYKEVFGEI